MLKNKKIKNFIEITFGVIIISLGYYFFLLPSQLVTGGIMGISIIIEDLIPFSPSIFLYICYGILISVGGLLLGKNFFFKSLYGAILQPTVIFVLEICSISPNLFLKTLNFAGNQYFVSMVFASILYGLGAGLLFKNNTTTGGMDTVQKIMSKYTKLSVTICIYITDGIVIILGIFKFGIEKGAFALLTMYVIGVIVDFVITGGKSKKTVQIITSKPNGIKNIIYEKINRGVTELNVYGGYTLLEKRLLLCVLSNREYIKIKDEIYKIDCEAFMVLSSANEVVGKGFSKEKFK